MKNIEEIREKLGPDYRVEEKDGVITVCDIWDGVEFARCIESRKGRISGREIFEGQVYRITGWENKHVMLISGFEIGWEPKGVFTPATEYEYVEQLKKEAKERFGEINDGDRFDIRDLGYVGAYYANISITTTVNQSWHYDKIQDTLNVDCFPLYKRFPLYKQGKWAKKVERVNVEVTNLSSSRQAYSLCSFYNIQFKTSCYSRSPSLSDISQHLTKCLEEYLNKS